MAELNDTDLFLVNRSNNTYKLEKQNLMAELQDTDLMLVNRSGTSYKVTGLEIKDSITGIPINPSPGQESSTPAYVSGSGTEGNPYVISPADCFLNGQAFSSQEITIFSQPDGRTVTFEDLNSSTNSGRFNQPGGITNSTGSYTFKFIFTDNPLTSSVPQAYTAKIRCGEVYWTWTVTMLDQGVVAPIISSMSTLSGTAATPPTAPLYTTEGSVGAAFPVNRTVGSLNTEVTSDPLDLVAFTGIGTGCQATVTTTLGGTVQSVDITEPGSNYKFGDEVNVNLSSIGGSSSETFVVYPSPCTGPSVLFTVTAFQGINSGGFNRAEFEISDDQNFLTTLSTFSSTTNATQYSVPVGVEGNTPYYVRMRYVTSDNVQSGWTPTVRSATGNALTLRYIWKNFGKGKTGMPTNSFDSGDFIVASRPHLYSLTISNGSLSLGGKTNCNHSNSNARAESARGAVYLCLRQPIELRITSLSGSGIGSIERISPVYGLSQEYDASNGGTKDISVQGGSGTGAKISLRKDADTSTIVSSVTTPGSNYQVGDIITVQPPVGNPQGDTFTELDDQFDVLIHGVGGGVNPGGWRGNGAAGGNAGEGRGGTSRYSLYAENGWDGYASGGGRSNCGTGGGAGWGSARGGSGNGGNEGYDAKGGSGASFYDDNMLINATEIGTDYGSVSCQVFVNGIPLVDGGSVQSQRLV